MCSRGECAKKFRDQTEVLEDKHSERRPRGDRDRLP